MYPPRGQASQNIYTPGGVLFGVVHCISRGTTTDGRYHRAQNSKPEKISLRLSDYFCPQIAKNPSLSRSAPNKFVSREALLTADEAVTPCAANVGFQPEYFWTKAVRRVGWQWPAVGVTTFSVFRPN